jgi:hypothetical protein
MLAAGQTAQHLESIRIIAVVSVIVVITFWRSIVRTAIMILSAALITLLGLGLYQLLEAAQR